MEKEYSYDELAGILGCSRTAIAKKVKSDENNPGIERYKGRYNVVMKDGKKCIVLDDEALEEEKAKSKGFKNVTNNSFNTPETQSEPNIQSKNNETEAANTADVTERYIDKFMMLQQHLYNQLHDRDKQILLLTVNDKQKEDAYIRTQAQNSELTEKYNVIEKKYKIAMMVIYCFITLSLIFATFFITLSLFKNNVSNRSTTEETSVTEQIQKKAGQVVIPARNSKEK